MASVTREHVLEVFKGADGELTTREVAERLRVGEYQARAAVSWLLLGGFLCPGALVTRKTRNGHPYIAASYRWSGKEGPVMRVRRDPDERRLQTFQESGALALQSVMAGWRRPGVVNPG